MANLLSIAGRAALASLLVWAILFLPAGPGVYWEAVIYCILLGAYSLASIAMLSSSKGGKRLLERRGKFSERRRIQSISVALAGILMLSSLLLAGLDRRFGISDLSLAEKALGFLIVSLGLVLNFLVLRENKSASRTIEVERGQKVVGTGPYSVVRHPMYFAFLAISIGTPFALGSHLALAPALLLPMPIALRIADEERLLSEKLAGYARYCRKVRFRLLPGVW